MPAKGGYRPLTQTIFISAGCYYVENIFNNFTSVSANQLWR